MIESVRSGFLPIRTVAAVCFSSVMRTASGLVRHCLIIVLSLRRWRGLTRKNALFLSAAAHANQQEVLPVYDWLRNGISVALDEQPYSWVQKLVRRLGKSGVEKRAVVELIQLADLGISDIVVAEDAGGMHGKNFRQYLRFVLQMGGFGEGATLPGSGAEKGMTLQFEQGRHGQALGIEDQSEGTIAWMGLLVDALEALEGGSLLMVDEIDTSLHPRLTARLVELFQDARTNPLSAQLCSRSPNSILVRKRMRNGGTSAAATVPFRRFSLKPGRRISRCAAGVAR